MLVLRNPWRGNKDIIMVVRNTSHLKCCLKVIMHSILGFHHHPNIFLLTGYNDILSKSKILKEDLGSLYLATCVSTDFAIMTCSTQKDGRDSFSETRHFSIILHVSVCLFQSPMTD